MHWQLDTAIEYDDRFEHCLNDRRFLVDHDNGRRDNDSAGIDNDGAGRDNHHDPARDDYGPGVHDDRGELDEHGGDHSSIQLEFEYEYEFNVEFEFELKFDVDHDEYDDRARCARSFRRPAVYGLCL